MAGTVVADTLQADSTSTLVIKNGVANTPPTIQDSAGTQIGTFCRAWVNFNGTGTVAIRASFNVTSITDNNTGDYTVNFTTAMPDANYSLLGTTSIAASTENPRVVAIPTHLAVPTASAARILTRAGSATSGTGNDTEYVYIAIFR